MRSFLAASLLILLTLPIPLPAAPLPEETPSGSRDAFGDPLPKGALMRFGTNRLLHRHFVTGMAISPDGKYLVSSSMTNRIHIWLAENGRPVGSWETRVPQGLIRPQFSPDGKYLAGVNVGKNLEVYEFPTGKLAWEQSTGTIRALGWSPDGGRLAVGRSDGGIGIVEAATGKPLVDCARHTTSIEALAFAPDGKEVLAVSVDFQTHRFDAASGKSLGKSEFPKGINRDMPTALPRIAFSPDGKQVAFADGTSGIGAWVWKIGEESARKIGTSDVGSTCNHVSFSRDGRFLVTGHKDGMVRLWGTASGVGLRSFPHEGTNSFAVLSPDALRLAVCTDNSAWVRLWDVAAARLAPMETLEGYPMKAVLLNDGKTLVTATFHGMLVAWNAATGKVVDRYDNATIGFLGVGTSADGRGVRAFDSFMRIVRWQPGKPGATKERPEKLRTENLTHASSPDGAWLVLQTRSGDIAIRDTETAEELMKFSRSNKKVAITALQLSADRRWLAAWDVTQRVGVWETASGGPMPTIGQVAGGPIVFSGDGRLLGARGPTGFVVWEIASGRERLRLPFLVPWTVLHAISPDQRLILASNAVGEVLLFDGGNGKEIERIPAHLGPVRTAVFAENGKRFLTLGTDGTVLLWDATRFQQPDAITTQPKSKGAGAWLDELGNLDARRAAETIRSLAGDPAAVRRVVRRLLDGPGKEMTERIAILIEQLDHPRFKVREAASKELAQYGVEVKKALKAAVEKPPSEEARTRIEALLNKIDGGAEAPAFLREFRLIETLERLGTKEARELLVEMDKSAPDSPLAREATAVLGRWRK